MKLRNKKTGDAVYVDFQIPLSNNNDVIGYYSVTSLKKLNESFEDYKPTEPLIKDEKRRKAVRAWAEANDIGIASAYVSPNRWYLRGFKDGEQGIDFWLRWEDNPGLIENKRYTIAELCGEEEE